MIPTAAPESLGFDPGRLARIKPWMQRWVDQGKFPGAQTLIARHGQIAYCDHVGQRDIEAALPWERDTIVRIYSMTKPITSLAYLMLFEDGLCHLDTPVDEFLPEFRDCQVLIDGAVSLDQVRPAETRMTVHHLLTHTSGFTYSFNEGMLAQAMLEHKLDFGSKRKSLDDTVKRLAELPLGFDPGAQWNYGVSTDVLGRVVEVITGQPLAQVFHDRILGPLGMTDTAFGVPEAKLDRFAACYVKTDEDPLKLMDSPAKTPYHADNVALHSGGGGLVSTIDDYLKFAELLRGKGQLGDVRLVAPRTAELMATNALPGDLASMGQPVFSEVSFDGVGFGLGVSVTINPGLAKTACSMGDFGWGGMASTMFWVDPVLDMVVIFMTQLVPSSSYPNRKELRAMAYSSLTSP
ncbi:MAG: serine hydrolase domain-containing protein [Paracoccaceae bacterium]